MFECFNIRILCRQLISRMVISIKTSDIIKALLKNIKQTLEFGDDVITSGFGKFQEKVKKSVGAETLQRMRI